MNKYLNTIQNFSRQDKTASLITKGLEDVVRASLYKNYSRTNLVEKFSIEGDYDEKNSKILKSMLGFCAEKTGSRVPKNSTDIAMCFSNQMFETIFNSIVVETLSNVMVKAQPAQMLAMADIKNVGVGESETYEIESKALPIMQRASYNNNVVLMDTFSKQSMTIVPKPWGGAVTIDYLQMLNNDFDFGREIARIAMAMLVAQYKLIAGIIFDTATISGTPFYNATWTPANYVKLAQYLKTFNGDPSVVAYGTMSAFSALSMLATSSFGNNVQDKVINDGYIGRIYGVDSVLIDQATNYTEALTSDNIDSQLIVPDDKLVLLSNAGGKPVKLVRENYVRVIHSDQTQGSQARLQYSFFNSFDAGLATQAYYGIQNVTA